MSTACSFSSAGTCPFRTLDVGQPFLLKYLRARDAPALIAATVGRTNDARLPTVDTLFGHQEVPMHFRSTEVARQGWLGALSEVVHK